MTISRIRNFCEQSAREKKGRERELAQEVKMSATVHSCVNTHLDILSYLMSHLTRTCAPGAAASVSALMSSLSSFHVLPHPHTPFPFILCFLPASHPTLFAPPLPVFLVLLLFFFLISLSLPHAWPGGSSLMHHGTFCSSKSQCDSALRSDRTTTSLSIVAHRHCAVAEPVQGEDESCEWASAGVRRGEEKRAGTWHSDIRSNNRKINN